MGIRIWKKLGYGLVDVEHNDGRIIDPRINVSSIFIDDDNMDEPAAYSNEALEAYRQWLEAKYSDVDRQIMGPREDFPDELPPMLDRFYFRDSRYVRKPRDWEEWPADRQEAYAEGYLASRRRRTLEDCFTHQAEYGLSNVLLLQPLAMKEWSRYADAIDYAWEWQSYPNSDHHVEFMVSPLYPFVTWMDKETGERVKDDMLWVLRGNVRPKDAFANDERWRYFPAAGEGELHDETTLDDLARSFGFEGIDWIRDHVVPQVPGEVRDLAEFGQLFTDPDVWKQLRPLIYTYWS